MLSQLPMLHLILTPCTTYLGAEGNNIAFGKILIAQNSCCSDWDHQFVRRNKTYSIVLTIQDDILDDKSMHITEDKLRQLQLSFPRFYNELGEVHQQHSSQHHSSAHQHSTAAQHTTYHSPQPTEHTTRPPYTTHYTPRH